MKADLGTLALLLTQGQKLNDFLIPLGISNGEQYRDQLKERLDQMAMWQLAELMRTAREFGQNVRGVCLSEVELVARV